MNLIRPVLPDLDYAQWREKPRMARIRTMTGHWAEHGFGTPDGVYLIYVVKIVAYVAGALLFVQLTPGIGSLHQLSSWWAEPVVFQKVVIFTLLFEVLGLGCGFGPLTLRFFPPIGGPLHWMRPGTIRLPPWPNRVPCTGGDTRTVVDVALYVGVLGCAMYALLSPATRSGTDLPTAIGTLSPQVLLPLLIVLPMLGLRDKVIFLAARAEVYWAMAVVFLLPGLDMIVAAKMLFLFVWWAAATSKLNRHFPHVVAVMMTNSPLLRGKALKRRFYRSHPDDLRPSAVSAALAHLGTAVEFLVPLALFASNGGAVTIVAAAVMVAFHLHILSCVPMAVPLEWNVYMLFGIGYLFVWNAQYGLTALTHPFLVGLIAVGVLTPVVLGNRYPGVFSFLPAMRYYAGNWATSMWCLKPTAVEKIERNVPKAATLPGTQLIKLYGEQVADLLSHKGYAFRAMHTHGRALFGLIPRACGPDHETDYVPVDGEFVAGTVLGWNFGDGHLHNEQLIEALQRRCDFDPGEVRVIVLESQPFGRPRQDYRLVDAATGEFERGQVAVADMLANQPWVEGIPAFVLSVTHQHRP
ncbi:DUF3556 domain-containing protein [Pseudonocardia spinosispora]|uniref:DUF3556 domain-containing protein n=1 Tax=Pseudonocardia spinosispora TaxID=103441 RepID=UPI00041C6B40|nr:DUF3556 domain-containing protein [Pseudonocardia spinosispora]